MDDTQKAEKQSLTPDEWATIWTNWNRIRKPQVVRQIVRHAVVAAVFVALAGWLYAVNEWAFALCSAGVVLLCVLRISDDVGELRDIRDCSWPTLAPTILATSSHSAGEPATETRSESRKPT